jgi:hypothetical protein
MQERGEQHALHHTQRKRLYHTCDSAGPRIRTCAVDAEGPTTNQIALLFLGVLFNNSIVSSIRHKSHVLDVAPPILQAV